MSTESPEASEDEYVGARVSPELKSAIRMRAGELNMNVSEYLIHLVEEDLEDVEYVDI